MLSLNRRAVLAALGSNLLAGPLRAQGRAVAPPGFTGRVFKGGVRVHTYLADAKGAMVTSPREVEKRGAAVPLIVAGHGEPTDLPGLVGYLEAVKPWLAANTGKPDRAKAITDEIAKAFAAYLLPPLTPGLSRALQS